MAPDVPVGQLEFYVDGVLSAQDQQPIKQMTVDPQQFADGYHEFRLVAIADDLVAATERKIFPVFIRRERQRIDIRAAQLKYELGDEIEIGAESNFGDQIELVHNGRVVGKCSGKTGTLRVLTDNLGRGQVTLSAFASESGSADKRIQSVPLELEITGPIAEEVPIMSKRLEDALSKQK